MVCLVLEGFQHPRKPCLLNFAVSHFLFKSGCIHALNSINTIVVTGRYKIPYRISSLSRKPLFKDLPLPNSLFTSPKRNHDDNILCQVEHLLCITTDAVLCFEPILIFWHGVEIFQCIYFCPLPFLYQLCLCSFIELPFCSCTKQQSKNNC